MRKNKIEEMILQYLEGNMTLQQEGEFREILKKNNYDMDRLSELEEIYNQMETFQAPEPSEKMDIGFYAILEKYKQNRQKNKRWRHNPFSLVSSFLLQRFRPQFATAFVLLFIGWSIGAWLTPGLNKGSQLSQMSVEIREMREMMVLTLIDQPSVTQRIKAVHLTNNFTNVNERVAKALLKTLNSDPNENVRLVTVEALYEFANNPAVREGLIQSITKQESALVQLALADVMIVLQEKRSVPQFNRLLGRKDLNDTIRNRIEKTVKVLL